MRRFRRATALMATALLLGTGLSAAQADDLTNDLSGPINTMVMDAGAFASTEVSVKPANGDGENGCNLQGGAEFVTFAVASSNPAVASVTPTELTFTKCGDGQNVTVTGLTAGESQIVFTVKDWKTVQSNDPTKPGGTFNGTPANFTVEVTGAVNTAPSIVVTGVEHGASYAKGSVPAAGCEVTDAEDGPSSFAATLSAVTGPYASDGIGSQTATCTYTDAGGLSATATATYSIADLTPPVVSYSLTPSTPNGQNFWYVTDVLLTWSVSDPESPNSLQHQCADVLISADQTATSYTCAATSAGGSTSVTTVPVKRDATAPEVPTFVGGPTGTIYYGDEVPTPTCTSSDATSGLAGCVVTGGGTSVGEHTFTATATDHAGNTSVATLTYEVRAWEKFGFYRPVTMDAWNTIKGGSTVPLKFEMFAGDREITDVAAVKSFTVTPVSCPGGKADSEPVDFITTGGTQLRYDDKDGQFIQNWATPKKPGSCYTVTMTAQDGGTISANFILR